MAGARSEGFPAQSPCAPVTCRGSGRARTGGSGITRSVVACVTRWSERDGARGHRTGLACCAAPQRDRRCYATLGPALTSAIQAEWKSVQGCADGKGDDDPGCACAQEGQDDAAAQQQEQGQGSGEDGVLPGVAEGAGERDGGAVDGADGGRPGAVQEGPGAVVAADAVEPAGAEQDKREG